MLEDIGNILAATGVAIFVCLWLIHQFNKGVRSNERCFDGQDLDEDND